MIQTSSGRVIFPVHFPWFPPGSKPPRVHARQIASAIYYSDDEGKTWTFAAGPLLMRGKTGARIKKRDLEGFWEPAIVEIAPGKLLMYMRSNSGWYYEVRSHDGGSTWENPRLLEFADPHGGQKELLYCYPSLLFNDGVLHLTYYGVVDGQFFNMLYQRLESDWFTKNMGVREELKKPKQYCPAITLFPTSVWRDL